MAATRGRDANVLGVVTGSEDVGEARDVLDTIVALDRADISAATERRTLAHQRSQHQVMAPRPTSRRTAVPDWYDGDLAYAPDAERDVHDGVPAPVLVVELVIQPIEVQQPVPFEPCIVEGGGKGASLVGRER